MTARENAIAFSVDGQACRGVRGQSLLDALRDHGFEVPSLCHLPGLQPYGACRLCLVEIEQQGRRRLTTSCNFPLLEGLSVFLDSERVSCHRRMVIGLLATRAPSAPAIRELVRRYGVDESGLAPLPEADDCILCGLCVRICRFGARAEALALAGRGRGRRLATRPFADFPTDCIACGACAWVCPTGAVSMEEEAVARLRARFGEERPCRYALLGLAPGSVCENDYRCATCQVDQDLVDRAGGRHPVTLLLDGEGAS